MKRFIEISCIFCIFIAAWSSLPAQNGKPDARVIDSIYEQITTKLEQPGGDTAHYFMLQLVRNQCRASNYDCSIYLYRHLLQKLSTAFNLPARIWVAEEMAKISKAAGQIEEEGNAYLKLSSYHDAFGNKKLAIQYLDRALLLFQKLGDQHEVLKIKMAKLEASADYQSPSALLDSMEALLQVAIAMRDSSGEEHIRIRSIDYLLDAKRYDDVEAYLAVLRRRKTSNPIQQNEYPFLINTNLGLADLAKARGQLDTAIFYYKKTLALAEAEPGPWMQMHVLNVLGGIELDQGNMAAAKSYLGRARDLGEKIEVDDLLPATFDLLARIAEAEKNFKLALEYTKLKNQHQQKFSERGAGFNMQAYVLQLEKKRLETERQKDQIALQLKNDQLRTSIFAIVFASLLAAVILFGLYKQQQGKKKIAEQYALIQQQAEQLKSLDAAKSRFFANISHELRTPLTLLLGPVKSLLKTKHSPQQQGQLLNMALQSGKQLQHLVNEILDLRKLEMGQMELRDAPIELTSFFNRYASQFDSLAANRQISFVHETNIEKGVSANIDGEKCRQVLHNLLANAFKFTPVGGQVRASLSLAGNTLTLEVEDTGTGIHPEDLPHVFDRFYQTSRPDKPAEGGTGIGLALCNEYAQLFGGKMEVESSLGQGSVFRAVFPVTLTENVVPEEESVELTPALQTWAKPEDATPAKPSGKAKPTILVVEDTLELQEYIRLILGEKYHVVTAGNGKEALEVLQLAVGSPQSAVRSPSDDQEIRPQTVELKTEDCQLIISDLMMPVMDGYQLLEKLKSDEATRHIPVIMLTARAEKDARLKALRIGVDDYLTKPFDEEELRVRIENLLANQATRKLVSAEEQPIEEAPALSQPDQAWLETFETFVRVNLSNDALTVTWLAQEFAMSESTMLRQLKRLTGLTPQQYLTEMRLDKARQLLEERSYRSVKQVATEVGYTQLKSFTRNFKTRFGKAPSEFLGN